jgi:hypothetical protein
LPAIAHQILALLLGRFLVYFCASCDPYLILEIFVFFFKKTKTKNQKKKKSLVFDSYFYLFSLL